MVMYVKIVRLCAILWCLEEPTLAFHGYNALSRDLLGSRWRSYSTMRTDLNAVSDEARKKRISSLMEWAKVNNIK